MPYKNLEDKRASARRSYARNKQAVGAKVKAYKAGLKQKWKAYKATLVCTVCSESDPITLDFHHEVRDPSNRKLYKLIRNSAWADVYEEIKKCVVLCSNCHRKHHQKERDEKRGAEAPQISHET
jgi:hypothetical protein